MLQALNAVSWIHYALDGVVLLLILIFAAKAAKKGFVKCFFKFISTIIAIVVAFLFMNAVLEWTNGLFGLQDIIKELGRPGRDPREDMPKPILRSDVLEMKDLKEGMILKGTVRNVIDFGAFVDIGVHQDGLVHISQICDRYIKHPLEAVSVGDIVEVKVISLDIAKKRIGLSMKDMK